VKGGLVIVTADDPEMHSSQNEQDNRHYAVAAKMPMLEPSDSAEAKAYTKLAFSLSERFDVPVFLRTATRVSHATSAVVLGDVEPPAVPLGFVEEPAKWVMLPVNARRRHALVEERMRALREFAETFEGNRIEWGDRSLGIITAGVAYQYVREAFPDASVLKLGLAHPLPERLVRAFAAGVKRLIVVEELDPIIETHVKALGIPVEGKDRIPLLGELNPRIVRQAISGEAAPVREPAIVPNRPPNLCAGCPHRSLFFALNKCKVTVTGDIGCYTLSALPPLKSMDTCVCMGASIGTAFGMEKALGEAARGKVVAVIGDSTFVHSGITGLINVVYNRGFSTVIILDNGTTAMTGAQDHPGTGKTLQAETTHRLDLAALCRAIGVEHVYTVNPHDQETTEAVLRREINRNAPSVIIARASCVLLPEHRAERRPALEVVEELCNGCKACGMLGCPAIEWIPLTPEAAVAAGKKPTQKGMVRINRLMCDGCNLCPEVCKMRAMVEAAR
jgi:indolepyruvate ferredoxin oxidoreductase alpha subunit